MVDKVLSRMNLWQAAYLSQVLGTKSKSARPQPFIRIY